MSKSPRPTFKPEFRLEVAQLVADQGYTIREASNAMNGIGTKTHKKIPPDLPGAILHRPYLK